MILISAVLVSINLFVMLCVSICIMWMKEQATKVSLVNIYFKLILILFQVLSNYPKESVPEMHLKITALELLRGKRAQWGIQRYQSGIVFQKLF